MSWPTVEEGWEYARKVASGDIPSTKFVQKQCEASLALLEDPGMWYFDEEAATAIIDFTQFTPHVKGELMGKPLRPEPWQVFILSQIYGWRAKYDPDIRKYRTVLLEVPRKNGKSFLCSVVSLYELLCGDKGGEVYSVATKKDQAKLVWDMAADQLTVMDHRLASKFHKVHGCISVRSNLANYKYVGRDSKTQDGFNPSLVIADEAAAIEDRNAIEVMESGMGARKSPLILYITTASFTRNTKYYEERQYLQNVLNGVVQDERVFGMIYSLESEDDYTDKANWYRCNPNLGISMNEDFLEQQVQKSQSIPSKRNEVLIKHFNIFTSTSVSWLPLEKWENNKVDSLQRKGKMWLSWDLATNRDLTSVCRVWADGDHYEADWLCFVPQSVFELLPDHLHPIFRLGKETGVLRVHPGEIVDYNDVQNYIENSIKQYNTVAVGGDPHNAHRIINDLDDKGHTVHSISQSIAGLNAAGKETERLIFENKLWHEGNPFIDWQVENAEVYVDVNDNIKVRKGDDPNAKIDSVIALICAMSMAAGQIDTQKKFNLTFV